MSPKQRLFMQVTDYFRQAMPEARTELHYSNPYELLVAVILSAQCTDRRINQVTPRLFYDYPTPEALAAATPEVIYEYIRSVSYPNNKAQHLVAMARMLCDEYQGIVPDDREQLMRLPGVGRKTANVILSVVFQQQAMAVDTHVFRVSHRLGLVSSRCTTPLSVEQVLTKYFPNDVLRDAHHWLILHGRYTCTARNPQCKTCGLKEICKFSTQKLAQKQNKS